MAFIFWYSEAVEEFPKVVAILTSIGNEQGPPKVMAMQ